ncbi:MAG: hypothetical protein FDZ70_09130, partial [Actinobacteria bacterium]
MITTSTPDVSVDMLLGLLRNPAGNPRAAALLLAALVVVTLVVIVLAGLLIVVGGAPPDPRRSAPGARKRRRKRARRELWVVVGAWMLGIAAAGAAGGIVLTDSSTCVRCHKDRLEMSAADARHHAEIDCAACHAVPGLGGRVVLSLEVLTDLYAAATKRPAALDERRPRSDACRRCHRGIGDSITRKIVRVSHKQFVDEPGWRCLDCHGATGHGPRREPDDRPRMTLCLRCHDGVKASSECAECHPGGITDVRGVSVYDYPQVELGPVHTCEGCHSMERCDACHG